MSRNCGSQSLAVILAMFTVFAAGPQLFAEEWYIPKRPEIIEAQRIEAGFRLQFLASDDGLLQTEEVSLIPSLRISPFDRFEAYVEVPYVFGQRDHIVGFNIMTSDASAIGDVFTQFTYEAFRGEDWALLPSLDVVFPTGRNPYDNIVGTGGGHYRLTPGVTVMKVVDPIVLFAYLGYQVSLADTFTVGKVEPGDSLRFRVGGAFHVNPKIRVSLFTATDIEDKTKLNGSKISGTGGNAVRFGAGLDWLVAENTSFNCNAVFGATDRAPDAVLTAGITVRF